MTLLALVGLWQILLLVAGIAMLLLRLTGGGVMRASAELLMNRWIWALCAFLPMALLMTSTGFHFQPVAKIVAAPSLRDFDHANVQALSPSIAIGNWAPTAPVQAMARFAGGAFLILMFIGMCIQVLRLVREYAEVKSLLGSSQSIRTIGRVTIAVASSDRLNSPLAMHVAGRAWVIVPDALVLHPRDLRIAILHELQHHRQRDTAWLHALVWQRALFAINPAVHLWWRVMGEVQELACDEELVDQGKVEPREYARCLIEMAERAVQRKGLPVSATGLAFLSERQSMTRRVEAMLKIERSHRNIVSKVGILIGTFLTVSLAVTAMAAKGLIADHRISLNEAQKLAQRGGGDPTFPVEVNDQVVVQLNRYLGTEQGRTFVSEALQRLEKERPRLEAKMAQYHSPKELLAVAMVESGYRNLPQSANKGWGAGVWMFIEQTARNFGLQVDAAADERLDVDLETDAAMRYLSANQFRFRDWRLAIMAYNMGEHALQDAIDAAGTRDPWALIRAGHEGDKGYLAKVMAAALILRNPQILD